MKHTRFLGVPGAAALVAVVEGCTCAPEGNTSSTIAPTKIQRTSAKSESLHRLHAEVLLEALAA